MSKKSTWQKIKDWHNRPKSFLVDTIESILIVLPIVFLIRTFIFGLYQVPTCSMETTMLVGERFLADKLTPFFKKPKHGEIISFNQPQKKYSCNTFINFYQRYISFNTQNWTKRTIACPGDHIEGKIEDGKPVVYLNGKKLDEPYLNKYPIVQLIKPRNEDSVVRRTFDLNLPLNSEKQPFYCINPIEASKAKLYFKTVVFEPSTPVYNEKGKCIDIYDVQLGKNEYWMMGDNRQGSYDSREWGPLNGKLFHGRILFRIWSLDSDSSYWIFDLVKNPINFFKKIRYSRCLQIVK